MANIFLFILIILSGFSTVVELVRAQQRNFNISLGSTLSPTTNTTSWPSSSGRFAFGFYPEGDGFNIGIWFAGIPQKTVVWTANQADPQVPDNAMLILTIHGLRTNQGRNISIPEKPEPVFSASMLDTGNFVLYNSKSEIIWQSFDFPSNTILQGQRLLNGRELFSSVSETNHSMGKFRLKMQNDGKIVQYPIQTTDTREHLYYVSGIKNMGYNVTLILDEVGELYLLNDTGFKIKTVMNPKSQGGRLPANGSIFYRMTIDADGIFRLYSHTLYRNSNWSIVEESSSNRCDPKGLCGVYSYCTLLDQNTTDCRCLPGFRFTDEVERTLGCIREVSVGQCENEEKQFRYKMSTLDDIVWEDSYYSALTLPTEEACRDACLRDCNCEAALFAEQLCRKQRLPLRYGRKRLDGLYTAFIKDTNKKEIRVLKPNDNNANNKKSVVLMIVILSVGLTVLVFGLIISYIIWRWRRKGGNNTESLNEDIELPLLDLITIENATNNFSETNKIGEGGFGPVYKGKLAAEGLEIAVKRLSKDSGQGLTEFKNEVILIAKLQHRNLVKLLGCCIQGEEKMLVYEYMPNESLNYFIFDERRSKLLDWEKRLDIIMGIARGLLYLHQDSRLRIIHRDLKASNILLDISLNPKISDFGMATLFEGDQTEAKTKRVVGTYGYMSPEYAVDGHFSMKSDVFSFGVLVLEIISGKRNRGFYHEDHNHNLLGHAWLLWKDGKPLELMDKCLGDSYCASSEILVRCIQVGLLCVQQLQEDRPSMSSVVSMLGSENHVLLPEPKQPGFFVERSTDGTAREESRNQVTISLLESR